eukprot:CAMPEP_0178405146 /NCGR_PEP_ID=MMETSP0689_2-20121128/18250_1 /TAXON_ID=160604 /ORGANISM="Amphidinium massartii, Strain CS-259" /LENGTH=494 /DNA_ID=CAMNT_0020026155 /DNA_START=57 /DNA_END=1541 /DNA_ORIENTATION=+
MVVERVARCPHATWKHMKFLVATEGSVILMAMSWAIPSAILGCLFHVYANDYVGDEGALGDGFLNWFRSDGLLDSLRSFSAVLGFLTVFRTQMAYSRFWEGAKSLRRLRGEWIAAYNLCLSFCSKDPEKAEKVRAFREGILKLMSLMFCTSMQQISSRTNQDFEVINLSKIPGDQLHHLWNMPEEERHYVVTHWVQRLVLDASKAGAIDVAPPVLSRLFHHFSVGAVILSEASTIAFVPFPFPYAQLLKILLILFSLVTPVAVALSLSRVLWVFVCTFVSVLVMWGINGIAIEIEMPFGEDANDLQLQEFQKETNHILLALLDDRTLQGVDLLDPSLVSDDDPLRTVPFTAAEVEQVLQSPPSSPLITTKARTRIKGYRPIAAITRAATYGGFHQPGHARSTSLMKGTASAGSTASVKDSTPQKVSPGNPPAASGEPRGRPAAAGSGSAAKESEQLEPSGRAFGASSQAPARIPIATATHAGDIEDDAIVPLHC